MNSYKEIFNYLAPIHIADTFEKEYAKEQVGNVISIVTEDNCDIDEIDVIFIGCGEFRNQIKSASYSHGPDKIREAFYDLFYWHDQIKIGDIGNIIEGNTAQDTYSALRTVITELEALGKKVVVLGGSHDISLQQYLVFKEKQEIVDMTVFDMLADINPGEGFRFDNHLVDVLTTTPNFIRNFSLIGFQSYYVNPSIVETLHRFGFDCIRVGKAREDLDQIEPSVRSSSICSIDINSIRQSDAPANRLASPNGFYGDEACRITRYAGLSNSMKMLGIYGYRPELDKEDLTAKLIAQMLWYYIDGLQLLVSEAELDDEEAFLEYNISFTDQQLFFKKSKQTNRWWMRMPDDRFIACSYADYLKACNNQMPERWLRELERIA